VCDIIDEYDLNYYEGNILKYLLRTKDNRIEDLKKLILAAFLLGLMSCEKEEPTPVKQDEPKVDCYCGEIINTYTIYSNGTAYEWIYTALNNCTNASKTFSRNKKVEGKEICVGYQW